MKTMKKSGHSSRVKCEVPPTHSPKGMTHERIRRSRNRNARVAPCFDPSSGGKRRHFKARSCFRAWTTSQKSPNSSIRTFTDSSVGSGVAEPVTIAFQYARKASRSLHMSCSLTISATLGVQAHEGVANRPRWVLDGFAIQLRNHGLRHVAAKRRYFRLGKT